MNSPTLKQIFNSIVPIDDEVWAEFEQYFYTQKLRKNELLWSAGDIVKYAVFIEKGLIRMFDDASNEDITIQFFFEGKILTDYYSYTTQNKCKFSYQILEDTELIIIPRTIVYAMYDKYPVFDRIGRLLAEQNAINIIEYYTSYKNLTPEEKYLKVLKERPKVMERVQLKYIASLLKMTPEHLSRIRKNISS
jgi:signal-transduction protein with cAMP-binding, CBS, and nucleotidyltransferase domain